MRGNIKSIEKTFTHAEVIALAERTLKRFRGDRNAAGRYARSMEDRYESAKWAQVVEIIATTGRQSYASEKTPPAQLEREIAEALARSPDSGSSRAFEDAKAEHALIAKEVDAASVALQTFPRSPMGGVRDDIREAPEFRAANERFQKAFARLRAFNTIYVKRFAKELRTESAKRYGR